MSGRRSYVAVLGLVLAVVVAVVVVDRLVPPPAPATAELSEAPGADTGGAWTCAVGDGRAGSEAAVTAIGPGGGRDEPGQLELGTFGDGDLDLGVPARLRPESAERATLEGGGDIAAFARWYDGPVALHREWRLGGEEDLPPGIAAGPCLADASARWLLPGMSTTGGHEARLRLANPHETDATVAIRLVTPQGPVEPTVLQNLTVEGRSTTEIEVNEHLPERDDVAAEVRVLSGRMAVEGYQLVRQAIGDVDGVSLLSPAARPSTTWTVPWVADGNGRQSWLWLLNPGERPAPVELTLHTRDGGIVPEGLATVTVEPGQLRRVDLRGTFPEGVSGPAVTARAEGAPIVAAGAVRQAAGGAAETGMAVQLGARSDPRWVLAGGQQARQLEQLRLINPGAEPAVVDVAVWDGAQLARPDKLRDIEVPAGALVRLDLTDHLAEAEGWAAFVTASEGSVVAGHVGLGGQRTLDLVAGPAIPAATWERAGPALVGRQDPGLTQRTGTSGPRRDGREAD